ncbi:MAG TPA: branched-chain amino acid ABC transporter permease [Thermodesulfobacteriota bacterium]|nr:branched-chain amino acid ABC transporter permease [Thermodesulfobacteriota bacterium]
MGETLLPQVIINGVTLGTNYILMALGFTLIFGVLRIVNFAHGEFYMLGAFFVLTAILKFEVNYLLAAILAVLFIGLLGYLTEEVIFRRFRDKELEGMIIALGLSILLQNLGLVAWGPYDLSIPPVFTGVLKIGTLFYPMERLMVVFISFLLMAGFYLFLKKTRLGLAIQAIAQDTEIARVQGMRINRLYPLAFAVGTGLAAAAGAVIGPLFQLNPWMGIMPQVKAFIVVILGGIGSIPGAFLGGLILGVAESFVSTYASKALADLLGFVLVIGILLFRPSGLFGRSQVSR